MPQETNLREEPQSDASGRLVTVNVRPPIQINSVRGRKKRIGFVGQAIAGGGLERWLGGFIQATRFDYEWVGVGCEGIYRERGAKQVGFPVSVGLEACLEISKQCDILIVWCSEQLHRYAYESKAKLVGTWHSGPGEWTAKRASLMDWDLFDAIHACSEYCIRSIPHNHQSRAHVVFNSVDHSWVRPTISKEDFLDAHRIPRDRNLFSYIGRLSHEKGWGAAVIGSSMASNSHVLISGGVPDLQLESGMMLATSELVPNSTFIGWSQDVGNVLQCSMALVTPSNRMEACQYTVMEAALAGVPVISTPFGIVHDRPEIACEILPKNPTHRDVTEACNRIISDPESAAHKASKARLLIASEFNMVVWREKWLRFLGGL